MNFGKFDMMILVTMSIAIVLISFTFPAAGLAGSANETAESDIPEFNTTSGSLDIVGEFPESPSTPSRGRLEYTRNESFGIIGQDIIYIERPQSDGTSLQIENTSTNGPEMNIYDWSSNNIANSDTLNITGPDWTSTYQNKSMGTGWTIEFETVAYQQVNTSDMYVVVEFNILENGASGGDGWLGGIPIIGGLWDAGEALGGILAYIGVVLYWGIGFVFEVAIALIQLLLDVFVFAVSAMHWMLSTYSGVTAGAPTTWASVILAIPGLLLGVVFIKLAMVSISLLPTT